MLESQPVGNDRQRPPEFHLVQGGEGNLFIGGFAHHHDTAGGDSLMAAQLEPVP
jgi:hypothetical protein